MTGEVELFRIRVAAAESKLKLFREKWRQAKRHRKEAKRLARSARKQFKQAKSDLAQICQALAVAEEKFFNAGERAQQRRMAKQSPSTAVEKQPSIKAKTSRRRRGSKAGVNTKAKKSSSDSSTGQAVRKLPLIEESQPIVTLTANPEAIEIISLPSQTSGDKSYEQTLG